MGFEGPPQMPSKTAEGNKADESERVDDVAKAQEVANAGNENRSWAARNREAANSEENANKKDWYERGARMQDKEATYHEGKAGEQFDSKKAQELEGIIATREQDLAKLEADLEMSKVGNKPEHNDPDYWSNLGPMVDSARDALAQYRQELESLRGKDR